MIFRRLMGGLMAAIILSCLVFADNNPDGGFYGTIAYINCDCVDGAFADQVLIKALPDGQPVAVGVSCRQGSGYYDSEASDMLTFEPGIYKLWTALSALSGCDHSQIVQVSHGYSRQRVDLIVYGPTGGSN